MIDVEIHVTTKCEINIPGWDETVLLLPFAELEKQQFYTKRVKALNIDKAVALAWHEVAIMQQCYGYNNLVRVKFEVDINNHVIGLGYNEVHVKIRTIGASWEGLIATLGAIDEFKDWHIAKNAKSDGTRWLTWRPSDEAFLKFGTLYDKLEFYGKELGFEIVKYECERVILDTNKFCDDGWANLVN